MTKATRDFLNDALYSLMLEDEMLQEQVVSLNAILRMIINDIYPTDFKYGNVEKSYAEGLLKYIEGVELTNPHNYIPLVRGYIRDMLNS